MSTAARAAAGYLALKRKPRRVHPQDGEVQALARQLVEKFNITEASAMALAKEQAEKRFYGRKR